jgi:hypothetical protein
MLGVNAAVFDLTNCDGRTNLCCTIDVLHVQLTAKVDLSEVQGLNAVLGDYVTR